jgi:hypothetical protein
MLVRLLATALLCHQDILLMQMNSLYGCAVPGDGDEKSGRYRIEDGG